MFLPQKVFPILHHSKTSFHYKMVHSSSFLRACRCWDETYSRCVPDIKTAFDGTTGYKLSYLRFLVCLFKLFRPQANFHDTAGAVRSKTGKRLGSCNMIGRGPKSHFFGHFIELLFCLYGEFLLLSLFRFGINLCSSMFIIVLKFELAHETLIRELIVYVVWFFSKDSRFCPPRK